MGKTIENSIRHGNHLPGTERYTRPEEIKSLGKYLKSGIKDRDSKLELEKDNLAAPKDSSAEYKEVTNLSDKIEILNDAKEIEGLSEKLINLDDVENNNELSDKVLEIEDNRPNSLSDTILDIIPEEIEDLSNDVLKIESDKENKLSDELLNLDTNSDVEELSNKLIEIDIDNESETKLSDKRLDLKERELEDLNQTKINLDVDEENSIKLGDFILELSKNENDPEELSNKIEKINNEEASIELSEHKTILKDNKNEELFKEVEEVSDIYGDVLEIEENNKKKELSDKVEILKASKDDPEFLSKVKELISDDNIKLELSDYVEKSSKAADLETLSKLTEKIENNKELSELLSKVFKIENEDNIEGLSKYIEIGPKKIDLSKLSEFLDKLSGGNEDETLKLSNYLELIKEYIIKDLPTDKKVLEVDEIEKLKSVIYLILYNKNQSLSNFISNIEDKRKIKLYTEIEENIEKKDTSELSNKVESITDEIKVSLSDKIDKISKNDIEELSKEKLDLEGEIKLDLPEDTIKIKDESEVSLSKTVVEGSTEKEVNLSDIRIEKPSEKEVNLSNTRVEGPTEKEVNLSNIRVEEPSEKEVNLSDIRIDKPTEKEVDLSNTIIKEPSEKDVNLSDIVVEEPVEKEVNLSNIRVEEPSEKEVNLSDKVVEEPTEKEVDLSNTIIKEPSEKEVNLSNIRVEEPSEKEVTLSELIEQSRVSESGSIEKTEDSFNKFSTFESDDLDWLKLSPEDRKKLSEIKELLSGLGSWGEKIDVYLTSILSGTTGSFIPESKTEAYKNIFAAVELPENDVESLEKGNDPKLSQDLLYKLKNSDKEISISSSDKDTVSVPEYKAPDFISSGVSGLIRSVAEKTVGKIGRGATKTRLINETLLLLTDARDLLEKATKSAPYRLPGNDAMGTFMGIVTNGVSSIGSALGSIGNMASGAKNKPYNRPEKDREEWVAPGQTVQDNAAKNRHTYTPIKGSFLSNLGDNLEDSILGGDPTVSQAETRKWEDMVRYQKEPTKGHDGISNFGMAITNHYLLTKRASESKTFDEFKEAVPRSPRITTPEKFTSTSNDRNYMTLDSNHVWEMLLRPYTGNLNGNRTWLPNIAEIDLENKSAFNVTTNYRCGWLPITGFELQSKKLTSKELPLFNGNIYYPIGMELTNELRITFADDSLKSMRRYFELASKTSVYMSNIHDVAGFGDPFLSTTETLADEARENPTAILEGRVNPSNYKNVSFLIDIFVMTPQFSTISRTQLLCILKDFTFEAQGETDSSPTELAVSFSIVGEWPKDGVVNRASATPELTFNRPDTTPSFGQSVLNNLGGVLSSF